MFLSPGCLPHLLAPRAYWCPDHYELEKRKLLASAWHLVGTTAELARPGDFLTCDLLGTPVQVRNFDGQLRALSNVCAHRHSLLTDRARGNSLTMRCQYHGWEYGPSGTTRRIPSPENFVPMPAERPCLPTYPLETAGQLVFVRLSREGPGLGEHLGPLHTLCVQRFGERWRSFLAWEPEYEANWKVPVENSLEAYHVPFIHARTFKEDPGEGRSAHWLGPGHTSFKTRLPFAHSRVDEWFQRCESWVTRRLTGQSSGDYWQHHVFPNLLFSFTDAVSLCQCVLPTGPATCRAVVRQFSPRKPFGSPLEGGLSRTWGALKGAITRQILDEDRVIFKSIQRGLTASPHPGLLGRCEERIHSFQEYVLARTS